MDFLVILNGELYKLLYIFLIGHISFKEQASKFFGDFLSLLFVEISDNNLNSLISKQLDSSQSQAWSSTCHDCN